MTSAFDPRIVQVTIAFPERTLTFEGLSIYASGQKVTSSSMSTCQCRILNLTKEQRNYIVSQTSAYAKNRTGIPLSIDVGRQSYGTFRLFQGFVQSSTTTQPPDIGIVLESLTNSAQTQFTTTNTQSELTQLSIIAQSVAANNGLTLNFLATDKQIENFSYNGSVAYQINSLNAIGNIIAFVDNEVLTVVDAGKPNKPGSRVLNAATGMVGIPQTTINGVIVRMMIDNTVQIGNMITLQSTELPAANGDYIISQLFYDVASRDQQFYYTLVCIAPAYYSGTLG